MKLIVTAHALKVQNLILLLILLYLTCCVACGGLRCIAFTLHADHSGDACGSAPCQSPKNSVYLIIPTGFLITPSTATKQAFVPVFG